MNINFYDKSLIATKALALLTREFGLLPSTGIAAGQAVASAIYEILGIGTGPFNDLDIFGDDSMIPYDHNVELRKRQQATLRRESKLTDALYQENSLSDAIALKRGSHGYEIISSYRDEFNEDINYILCNYSLGQHNAIDHISNTISCFDINCCQVGIDLSTGQIEWTEDFESFLFQKKLSVVYFGTPMHSSIRILKKQKDLMNFATLDIDYELKKLQLATSIVNGVAETRNGYLPGNLFSDVYKARFHDHESVLRHYYTIENKEITFDNADPNTNITLSVTKQFHILKSTHTDEETMTFFRSWFLITGERKCETGLSYQLEDITSLFNSYYHIKQSPKKWAALRYFTSHLCSIDAKVSHVMLLKALTSTNVNLLNISAKDITVTNKVLTKHPQLLNALNKLSLTDIIKYGVAFRYFDKHGMSYRIGWYENTRFDELNGKITPNASSLTRGGHEANDFPCIHNKHFMDLIKQSHNNYLSLLKAQSVPKGLICILQEINRNGDMHITELTTGLDLFIEGEKLGHCVGGYFSRLFAGDFIVSIRDVGKHQMSPPSTALISLPIIKGVVDGFSCTLRPSDRLALVAQHFGKGNAPPHENNCKILTELVAKIADQRKAFLLNQIRPYKSDVISSIAAPSQSGSLNASDATLFEYPF